MSITTNPFVRRFPLIVAAFLAVLIGSWVVNIVKLVFMLSDPALTPMFFARVVGIFVAPLGAVLGFF